jgi:hypothetical protein
VEVTISGFVKEITKLHRLVPIQWSCCWPLSS